MSRPHVIIIYHYCLIVVVLFNSAMGWSPPSSEKSMITRKEVLVKSFSYTSGLVVLLGPSMEAQANVAKPPPKYLKERGSAEKPLSFCPGQPAKKNCWSTEDNGGRRLERWTPPAALAEKGPLAVFQELQDTIGNYPQEGQNGVDLGGWRKMETVSTSPEGVMYSRYEFVSGRFKYIDDLEIRVDPDGKVCARTSSREGGYDYEVNKIRINYISGLLEKKGWIVKYV